MGVVDIRANGCRNAGFTAVCSRIGAADLDPAILPSGCSCKVLAENSITLKESVCPARKLLAILDTFTAAIRVGLATCFADAA